MMYHFDNIASHSNRQLAIRTYKALDFQAIKHEF